MIYEPAGPIKWNQLGKEAKWTKKNKLKAVKRIISADKSLFEKIVYIFLLIFL